MGEEGVDLIEQCRVGEGREYRRALKDEREREREERALIPCILA